MGILGSIFSGGSGDASDGGILGSLLSQIYQSQRNPRTGPEALDYYKSLDPQSAQLTAPSGPVLTAPASVLPGAEQGERPANFGGLRRSGVPALPVYEQPSDAAPSLPDWITAQSMAPAPQRNPQAAPATPATNPAPAAPAAAAPGLASILSGAGSAGQGLLDHLTAGATNLTTGGNPIAGLFNSINGLMTGTRTDRAGITQQSIKSTYAALVQAGLPPGLAQAAALNPEVLKTIAPELYQKPTLTKTGTDPLTGQDSYVWAEPDKKRTTAAIVNGVPVTGTNPDGTLAAASAPASLQSVMDNIEKGRASGAPIEKLAEFIPNSLREGVLAMIQGKALPASLSNRGAARDLTVRFAHAIDPNFDETLIPMRTTFAHGMAQTTPTSNGGQKILLNTAIQHLGELAGNYAEMHNTNGVLQSLPGSNLAAHAYNAVANSSSKMGGLVTAIEDNADKVAGETGKLYSGQSGGGQSEREAVRSRFGPNITPNEAIGGLQAARNMIMDKLNALQNQRDQAYGSVGENVHPLVDKETQDALKKIDESIAKLRGGSQTQSAAPSKPDAEGWITMPGGVRIRQKPGS